MEWKRIASSDGSLEYCCRKGRYFLVSRREADGRHWRLLRAGDDASPEDIGGRGPIDGFQMTGDEEIEDIQCWADSQIAGWDEDVEIHDSRPTTA
jgi:hypothetical protein